MIEAQQKDPTISFIIRLLCKEPTKPVRKEVESWLKSWWEADEELSDRADLNDSAATAAQDTVPLTPPPQSVEPPLKVRPKVQRAPASISVAPKPLREPKAVNAGNGVEWNLPGVERTRQKRACQPPADPRATTAGSGIPPDVNSSKVRPTCPKRVRFAPRYMNEYYLFD